MPAPTLRQRRLRSIYDGSAVPPCVGAAPRIAIVGAGLAGLAAAHVLRRAGCRATVYDAAAVMGGRVRTDFGGVEPGVVSELGGEFVDSGHDDMLALAAHFDLPLIDTAAPAEAGLATTYHFGGQRHTEAQVLAAYRHVAPRIAADAARLSAAVSRARHTPDDAALDRLCLAEYLDGLDMDGWLRRLIETAYVAEHGLDAGEQSCINLLSMIGTDTTRGFRVFGDSDERYKLRDGAARLVGALAHGLAGQLELGHRLVRLRGSGAGGSPAGWRLAFQTAGPARETVADAVVLALPFTLLRQVDLGDSLPPEKLHAVRELGYGSNAKLLIGTRGRFWRAQGLDGGLYTDLPAQTGWDASRQRDGTRGVYTFFLGGRLGAEIGQGSESAQAARLAASCEAVFPGLDGQRTGSAQRAHWAGEPYALGSYSCFRPGQWTTIAGLPGKPVGSLHFAGEHCSVAAQGYMNGAAETGRRAAQALLRRLA